MRENHVADVDEVTALGSELPSPTVMIVITAALVPFLTSHNFSSVGNGQLSIQTLGIENCQVVPTSLPGCKDG